MRFSNLLVTFCLVFLKAAYAQARATPNGILRAQRDDGRPRTNAICKRLQTLTAFNNTASTTNVAAQLELLISNTTLTAECDVINADHKAASECKKLKKLEKLAELASEKRSDPEPLVGEILNEIQQEYLTKTMEEAELNLQQLRTNSTLMNVCGGEFGSPHEQQQSVMIGSRECIEGMI